MVGFAIYVIIGLFVSFINWFYVVSYDTKNNVNICIALPLCMMLWPIVIIGWIYRFIKFI